VQDIVADVAEHLVSKKQPLPPTMEVVWTADFAKFGATLSGYQPVGNDLQANSSSNYRINNIFFAPDSTGPLRENLQNSLTWGPL